MQEVFLKSQINLTLATINNGPLYIKYMKTLKASNKLVDQGKQSCKYTYKYDTFDIDLDLKRETANQHLMKTVEPDGCLQK